MRTDPTADAMHAAALLDLLAADTTGNSIERSVSLLEMTVRIDPSPAAYADLSAAHLILGASRGRPGSYVAGLDAALRSLDRAPSHAAARYNAALSMELLGLEFQADEAWRSFLEIEPRGHHAMEATRRRAAIAQRSTVSRPAGNAPSPELDAHAAMHPADAIAMAWETMLPAWSEAVQAGDTSASARLRAVESVGARLARDGRDSAVRELARAIRRASDGHGQGRRLADMLHRFSIAQRQARRNAHGSADSVFRAIMADPAAPAPLRLRARFAHANARIYLGDPEGAAAFTRALLRERALAADPVIVARAWWNLGILALRANRHDEGLALVDSSRAHYLRLGDAESVAGATGIVGERAFQTGDDDRGFHELSDALRVLRTSRGSIWRHNLLLILARAAGRNGFIHAVRVIEDEDAATAGPDSPAASTAEVHLSRARSALAIGQDPAGALDAAASAMAEVPDSSTRTRLLHDLRVIAAPALARTAPDRARAWMDDAIDFYDRVNLVTRLIPALLARSELAVARGAAGHAEADLVAAARRFDAARAEIRDVVTRATFVRSARNVFERLALLHAARGESAQALTAMEQAREWRSVHAIPRRGVPSSTPVVSHAMIGDTLLTWVVAGRDTHFVRARVSRAGFRALVERTRAGLELGSDESVVRPRLDSLFDYLVRPVAPWLRGDRLAVVADGDLADVPFAALRDSSSGTYLIERFAITHAPTVASAQHRAHEAAVRPSDAVFLSPSPASGRFARLASLPHAAVEGDEASRWYARATRLTGPRADSSALVAAMARAQVVHFAGHAVFNDAAPARSELAVDPRGVSAAAIASLQFPRLRLVVLAACETVRAPDARANGFAGFVDAFAAAGARGVVGSVWRVDDAATGALMRVFHEQYAAHGDAAAALQTAQLSLRRGGMRAPGMWGGFRYLEN